jgi:N-acetylglucosamine-6-sulfatase
LNENNEVRSYGYEPVDYLTDVISAKASDFIVATAAQNKPFLIEVSTYTPHSPYTPAPQDGNSFPGLKAPRNAADNKIPRDAPPWLGKVKPLTEQRQARINTEFRNGSRRSRPSTA